MAITLDSRKPVNRLTVADLDAYPIWEFAHDEEHIEERDETWVRPLAAQAIASDADSLSVSADFQTSSGKPLRGLVGVSVLGDLEFTYGAVFVNGRYLPVATTSHWRAEALKAELLKELGLPEAEVFPLQFTLGVPMVGEVAMRRGAFA